jgi:hypothetical protein
VSQAPRRQARQSGALVTAMVREVLQTSGMRNAHAVPSSDETLPKFTAGTASNRWPSAYGRFVGGTWVLSSVYGRCWPGPTDRPPWHGTFPVTGNRICPGSGHRSSVAGWMALKGPQPRDLNGIVRRWSQV